MSLDPLRGKTILLAGGSGLAGSCLAQVLLERFPEVQLRASYSQQPPNFLHPRIDYRQVDVEQLQDCRNLVAGCQGAFFLVARSGGVATHQHQAGLLMNGPVALHSRLFEAAIAEGIGNIVCCSSVTVYQEFSGAIREDQLDLNQDPLSPHFGVGWSNRYLEKMAQFWSQQSGVHISVARAANIFGPYARFDPAYSNFIPALIRKAVDRLDPFEVWGHPEVTRDVIYVRDFAEALVELFLASYGPHPFEVFNVGSSQRTRVADVVELVLEAAGHRPSERVYQQDRPTSMAFRALDCSKIEQRTGWKARHSLAEGIALTTRWWEANQGLWKR